NGHDRAPTACRGTPAMIVLGIDTSTSQTSVALGTERGTLAAAFLSTGQSHHEAVTPAVDHITRWSGTSISHIGGVAVCIGPGLFTGLRVGIQTGKSIAQVLSLPMVALVELSIPRFHREEFDRVADVVPLYLRKSDAEIAWDKRARTG